MIETLTVLIRCLGAVLLAIFEGNGAVYFFNKMPAKWFCDYGQEPTEEIISSDTQRVKSYPWKFVLTMLFVVINIKLVMEDIQFAVAASISLWIMLELAISDIKYRLVPDELLILLAVGAMGFLPYLSGWKECLLGAATGFLIVFVPAVIGKMAYKRDTIGGGDIKLFTVIGFICGISGVLTIFMISTFISAAYFIILIASKKIKRSDSLPLVPHVAIATGIYYMFLWDMNFLKL